MTCAFRSFSFLYICPILFFIEECISREVLAMSFHINIIDHDKDIGYSAPFSQYIFILATKPFIESLSPLDSLRLG